MNEHLPRSLTWNVVSFLLSPTVQAYYCDIHSPFFHLDIPTHTGAKPYKVIDFEFIRIILNLFSLFLNQCNICSKEFRQPCPYKKHLQTHAEQRSMDITNVPLAMTSSVVNDNVNSIIS